MRRLLLSLALIVLVLPFTGLVADEAKPEGEAKPEEKVREIRPWSDVEEDFDKALKNKDPDVRARAFQILIAADDVRAVNGIVKSLKKIRYEQDKVRKGQKTLEAEYEKQFNQKLKADAWWRNSTQSAKDLDRYNKGVKKISKKLDRVRMQQRLLENDFRRLRAMLDDAIMAMRAVLENLGPKDLPDGLDRLAAGWLESKKPGNHVRWVDSIADLDRPEVEPRLVAVVGDVQRSAKLRGMALEALASRGSPHGFHMAMQFIEHGAAWDLILASIESLRRIHEKRCIEPLIGMLADEALLTKQKRLREDLHQALKSLTGLQHGPYAQPWQTWWEREGRAFDLPEKPVVGDAADKPKEGVTFYGIHTFSDRVLFILDISGSMTKAPTKKDEHGRTVPTGPPNIETARTELKGAIHNLNMGDRFNVIFFNHEVMLRSLKMIVATDTTKRLAVDWLLEQEPEGTTNIYDAFEKGFGIALAATGEPIVDTIFFMTDGRPTSGQIQDPKQILAEVLEWNRAAKCRIHTVGIGNHERWLLEQLALKSGGTYVNRGAAAPKPEAHDGR